MSSRLKSYEYAVTFTFEALNFDKAKAKADDLDRRVEKTGAKKAGEARLRARGDDR